MGGQAIHRRGPALRRGRVDVLRAPAFHHADRGGTLGARADDRAADGTTDATVPGDDLCEALAPERVNTGVLLREINERIINLSKDHTDEGQLARRICGLVFLISRLPREAGADIGVRASK